MDKSISPEREIKRKLNKMRKTPSSRLELRLKLNKMLKDGQLILYDNRLGEKFILSFFVFILENLNKYVIL